MRSIRGPSTARSGIAGGGDAGTWDGRTSGAGTSPTASAHPSAAWRFELRTQGTWGSCRSSTRPTVRPCRAGIASNAYAVAALKRAIEDGIPAGTAIAIDIEPVGSVCPGAAHVDKAFIEGWFDVIRWSGYTPAFYGNTIPRSAFANAWCAAVTGKTRNRRRFLPVVLRALTGAHQQGGQERAGVRAGRPGMLQPARCVAVLDHADEARRRRRPRRQ